MVNQMVITVTIRTVPAQRPGLILLLPNDKMLKSWELNSIGYYRLGGPPYGFILSP
jgi:hypothetical protein